MSKLLMLRGLPASGKSSYAKELLNKGGWVRLSKDDIRRDFLKDGWTVKKERQAVKIQTSLARNLLEEGKNVIIDDTNLNPVHERRWRDLCKELGVHFEINDSFLEVTPQECVERDLHRGEKAVGADVIWNMYTKYIVGRPEVNLEKDDSPRCIICDLDGTLALNREGRDFRDMTRVGEDSVDPFMAAILEGLYETYHNNYLKIFFVSGRQETAREATEAWLDKNMIQYDALFMREEGDFRKDYIVKEEIYHTFIEPEYAVLGVFDDRPQVIRNCWQKLGLRVAKLGVLDDDF